MQAVSLIQRSALLEQFSQVFKQTSYKVFTKFWIFTKIDKVLELQFFTEFLHYKVLTKSTKFIKIEITNFTKLWKLTVH